MPLTANYDLFRRLSSFTQGLHATTSGGPDNSEVRKRPWDDEVARITQGRTYMYKQFDQWVIWWLHHATPRVCRLMVSLACAISLVVWCRRI